MSQAPNSKPSERKYYDLEERCLRFAKRINQYVRKPPRDIPNIENGRQLVRAGGSVGANYIEANESLSKRDFIMRAKISKKEVKEARHWVQLTEPHKEQEPEKAWIINEASELGRIFGSILEKSK